MKHPTPDGSKSTRTYPSSELSDLCREAGADTRLMWEIPGPKDTLIAWLSCYSIGDSLCIVQTFKDGNGWMEFTPSGCRTIDGAVNDVLQRCKVPSIA